MIRFLLLNGVLAIFQLTSSVLTGADPLLADGEKVKAVRLQLHNPQKGDRWKTVRTNNEEVTISFTLSGMTKTEPKKESKTLEYTYEILAKPPGAKKATRFSRTHTKAEKTVNGKKNELPYAGLAIVFEKKGDDWQFTTDGEELSDAEAADFKQEFKEDRQKIPDNQAFLPEKPIRPGDSWNSDPEKVLAETDKLGPFTLDKKNTILKGKLIRTYEKDGRLHGILRLDQVIAVKSMDVNGNELPAKEGSVIRIGFDIDTCIDGSDNFEKSTGITDIDLEFEVPNGSLKLTGKNTTRETTVSLPSKE